MNVAVLGMGVGGLAAAILLARRGHRITVYDRMARPGPVGSGFVLQPTGLVVLGRMGLLDETKARGSRIDRMLGIVQPSGRTVLDVGYRKGASGLAVQRHALFDILHRTATAAGVEFRLGSAVMGVDEGKLPRPVIETMRTQPGFDLVVDAMGSRSPTHDRSREIGYGALWATVPWSAAEGFHPHTLEQRYRRANRMAGVLPVGTAREGAPSMATVFWSVKRDAPHDAWKEDAAGLWPEMEPLLEQAHPVHATYRHHTRPAIAMPRVIRIGDAWHATSPQLGQGANMALLDALSLDMALDRTRDIHNGLVSHVQQRKRHVSFYQTLSLLLTPFYQSDGVLLPAMRDHLVAPLLRRRGLVHAMIASMVSGGFTDPIRRITSRYEEEVFHLARSTRLWESETTTQATPPTTN